MTVYESKGLEFDDVILYNFFADSHTNDGYRIIKEIEVHNLKKKKVKFDDDLTINELDFFEYNKKLKKYEEEQKVHEYENIPEDELEDYCKLIPTRERDDVLRNFSLLCNDLKHLYVSVTRPKQRLLIYDQDTEKRNAITKYWVERGVVDVVHKGEEKDHPVLRHGFETLSNEASSKQEWLIMGVKLFRKKFYSSAATCFERSEDFELRDKCDAYAHADKATSALNESEALQYAAKNNRNLKKHEKSHKRKEAKEFLEEACREYILAGEIFEKIGSNRQAAQCFYSAQDFNKSAELFEKSQMYSQAAECYMTTHQYAKAAKMFEESRLILKALECYEYLFDWEAILLCLNRNKEKFKPIERESLTNKYIPLALNSIFKMLQVDNDEENKGKLLADKYKSKIQQIQEEQSENSSDEETDVKGDKKDNLPSAPSVVPDQAVNVEIELDKKDSIVSIESEKERKMEVDPHHSSDDEEEDIVTSSKQSKKLDESSFDIISKAEINENFEHLSNFDPEDEFLSGNRSFSVIGSVISNDEKSIADYSEFSIVSGSRIGSIVESNVIQTNRDIYIEDVAMQKIIYYISLFSEETRNYLQRIRSRDQLFQSKDDDLKADAFELELDNISIDFIKILLDVLESYDMFRLCMIVCNRYHITDQLSRYLTSVCYKYSNLKLLSTDSILKINDPLFRKQQAQVSILANEAVHNMFALISPEMIQQVRTEDLRADNKVASNDCWRFLFYLGFWKKLIYIMDSIASLKLCYSIGDLNNFKIVYLVNYRSELEDEEIKRLSTDQTGEWIDKSLDRNTTLGTLCYKVLMEDYINSMNTEAADPDFECNIGMNKWLKMDPDASRDDKKAVFMASLNLALKKLKSLMTGRNNISKIGLFDM